MQQAPLGSLLEIRAGISLLMWKKVWGLPGVETPITLDAPDALDGGDALQDLGVGGLASGSSSGSGCGVVSLGSGM